MNDTRCPKFMISDLRISTFLYLLCSGRARAWLASWLEADEQS